MRRIITTIMLLLGIMIPTIAQIKSPVKFAVKQKQVSEREFDVIFSGTISNGWHVYSTGLPDDGPVSASFHLEDSRNVKAVGRLKPEGNEIKKYEDMFGMDVRYFEHSVQFVQRIQITGDDYEANGYLEYGACNDENCLPPTSVDFSFSGKVAAAKTDAAKDAAQADEKNAIADSSVASASPAVVMNVDTTAVSDLWTPVIDKLNSFGEDEGQGGADRSLLTIFLLGFLGGLVALATPCVWPIIPMTVSFFLKRSADRSKAIRDAFTYGASIVVIYMLLAVVVTLLSSANQLNALSTSAVANIFFFLLLVVFGLSFLGLFEITLPASWSTAVDSKADKATGLLSIFLMAFTLALVSFSCTGPIIGFLLVEISTTGELLAPSLGMLGFAIALALPFTLFALFPAWLKQAPKSGSWMVVVKVFLGFIELAFALKFFSVADMAYGWNLLFRDLFIGIWIVLFAWLALFLFGLVKIPDDHRGKKSVGKVRILIGIVVALFVCYLVPGLWGAPVKLVSAFTPPMSTQKWKLVDNSVKPMFSDYDEGMAYAREHNKPVMLDFTGLGCVNCRKMEAAVWTDPKVREMLENDYVLIELYTDNKKPLPQKLTVTEADGSTLTLRTLGDKWSYLQRHKFGSNTQPFYVLVDGNGNPLYATYSYDEDIDKFVKFLKTGIENSKVENRQ